MLFGCPLTSQHSQYTDAAISDNHWAWLSQSNASVLKSSLLVTAWKCPIDSEKYLWQSCEMEPSPSFTGCTPRWVWPAVANYFINFSVLQLGWSLNQPLQSGFLWLPSALQGPASALAEPRAQRYQMLHKFHLSTLQTQLILVIMCHGDILSPSTLLTCMRKPASRSCGRCGVTKQSFSFCVSYWQELKGGGNNQDCLMISRIIHVWMCWARV